MANTIVSAGPIGLAARVLREFCVGFVASPASRRSSTSAGTFIASQGSGRR